MGLYEQMFMNAYDIRKYLKYSHNVDDVGIDAMYRSACDSVEHYIYNDLEYIPPAIKLAVFKIIQHCLNNRPDIVELYTNGDYSTCLELSGTGVEHMLGKYRNSGIKEY